MTDDHTNDADQPEPEAGPEAARERGARRGRLTRAGIVALAIVALIAVPAYLSTLPSYLQRYPGLRVGYRTWARSSHADSGCAVCHSRPGLLNQAGFRARMLGEFYLTLVPGLREPALSVPTNDACLVCHTNLRTVSPSGDLRIPHRAHVSVLKIRCVECHAYLVHSVSPEGSHNPPMTGCLKCHNGDRAKNSCSACHTEKAAPASHRAKNWLVVHRLKTVNGGCIRCHKWAKNWCAECHSHRPRSHVLNWRAAHGRQVAKHRGCEACHQGAFCIRCHGEVPRLGFDPTLKRVR